MCDDLPKEVFISSTLATPFGFQYRSPIRSVSGKFSAPNPTFIALHKMEGTIVKESAHVYLKVGHIDFIHRSLISVNHSNVKS